MKKTLKSTKQTNTLKSDTPKIVRATDSAKSKWLEGYTDCFGMKDKPVTEAFLERFSNELITWAKNDPKALKVTQFHLDKNIPPKTYYEWVDRYPIIKNAHEYAKAIIGNRRELGALERKYDSGIVTSMMPFYDPEWKLMAEWKAKLRQEADEASGTKIVILEKFPSSDLVPEKKKRVKDE